MPVDADEAGRVPTYIYLALAFDTDSHVIPIFVGAMAAYRLLCIFANCATRGELLTHFLLPI